jgi:hypothetical protein
MRVALPLVVVVLGAGVAACSVVFDPERYDDVERCRYDDDCPDVEDPRYEYICTVSEEYQADGEDADLSFPRICSPRASVSCDPNAYAYDSQFRARTREATSGRIRYETVCSDLGGVQGCPPDPEHGCEAPLRVHPLSGRCDDEDESTPPAIAPEPSVAFQDVVDQFCRSVYCDIAYTCHVRDHVCEPCVLGEPLGRGGCGDLYPMGRRSGVYQSSAALIDTCRGADADPELAFIGPLEESLETPPADEAP